ncbi:hypothetical protein, partial [Protofrankia symbiont of Coriaria ruscifolia]|uniref:hypothetical protein n=1 Tax=Protofrankia symbiont of Coriaria ruscifolia TaxID=1306542 RepID=UPI001A950AAA
MSGGRGSQRLVVVLAGCAVVLANAGAALVNVASGRDRWPGVLDLARAHPFWSAGVVSLLAAGAAVRLQEGASSAGVGPPPLIEPPGWVVGRPVELGQVVAGLRR